MNIKDMNYEEFRQYELENNLAENRDLVLELGYLAANPRNIEAIEKISAATDPKAGLYGTLLILISEKIQQLEEAGYQQLPLQ